MLGAQVTTPVDFGKHEQLSILSHYSLRTRHLLNMAMGTFLSFSSWTLTSIPSYILLVIAGAATQELSLHWQWRRGKEDKDRSTHWGILFKPVWEKGKGQRQRKGKEGDFFPLGGLIYMKVLSKKKAKQKQKTKTLFWPYASLWEPTTLLSDKNVYLVKVMKSLLLKYRELDFIFADLVCKQKLLVSTLKLEDPETFPYVI